MFSEIPITALNDFLFCPRSLYFHYEMYESLNESQYKAASQKRGTLKHTASDEGRYSSSKRYRQGMEITSRQYGLVGKIDIYDTETKTLIERKTKIQYIFPGYRMQVFAQTVCLEEMGLEVRNVFLHSLSDNKKYPIVFTEKDCEDFLDVLEKMRGFDISQSLPLQDEKKCAVCIYRTLCRGGDVPNNF